MPLLNMALWLLLALALALAGVLMLLDEILSDTPHAEPEPYAEPESEDSERHSPGECRT